MAAVSVQKIACINAAGFVMNFSVCYLDENGHEQVCPKNSGNYPIDQTKTIDLIDQGVPVGAWVWPKVHAVAGLTHDGDKKVKYEPNGQTATYNVHGTTLSYGVNLVS